MDISRGLLNKLTNTTNDNTNDKLEYKIGDIIKFKNSDESFSFGKIFKIDVFNDGKRYELDDLFIKCIIVSYLEDDDCVLCNLKCPDYLKQSSQSSKKNCE